MPIPNDTAATSATSIENKIPSPSKAAISDDKINPGPADPALLPDDSEASVPPPETGRVPDKSAVPVNSDPTPDLSAKAHSIITSAASMVKKRSLCTPRQLQTMRLPDSAKATSRRTEVKLSAEQQKRAEDLSIPASELSLGEFSARASFLQQRFREERIRQAEAGELPDPLTGTPSEDELRTLSSPAPEAEASTNDAVIPPLPGHIPDWYMFDTTNNFMQIKPVDGDGGSNNNLPDYQKIKTGNAQIDREGIALPGPVPDPANESRIPEAVSAPSESGSDGDIFESPADTASANDAEIKDGSSNEADDHAMPLPVSALDETAADDGCISPEALAAAPVIPAAVSLDEFADLILQGQDNELLPDVLRAQLESCSRLLTGPLNSSDKAENWLKLLADPFSCPDLQELALMLTALKLNSLGGRADRILDGSAAGLNHLLNLNPPPDPAGQHCISVLLNTLLGTAARLANSHASLHQQGSGLLPLPPLSGRSRENLLAVNPAAADGSSSFRIYINQSNGSMLDIKAGLKDGEITAVVICDSLTALQAVRGQLKQLKDELTALGSGAVVRTRMGRLSRIRMPDPGLDLYFTADRDSAEANLHSGQRAALKRLLSELNLRPKERAALRAGLNPQLPGILSAVFALAR